MAEPESHRGRGLGSLFRRGPVWWLKYYRHGKPYRESSRTADRRKAEKLLKRRLAEIETGQFRGLQIERVRFDELASDLQNDYTVNQRKSAVRNSRSIVHLRNFFGGWRAVDLTTDQIRRYIAKRQGEGAANGTVNRELAALKRMFNLATEMTPPKVVQVPHIPMLKEAPPRKGFLEQGDFLKLRNALSNHLKPLVTMAYYTGMRAGEILSLRWEHVDLLARQIRLDPGTTKNENARTIPLTGETYEWLRMQKQARDSLHASCPWVFFRNGNPIRSFKNGWKRACERVGLPCLLFHDLRRSGVRNLVRAGVPERVAMAISGHRTRSVFDRYNIDNDRDLREAARRLEEYLKDGHNLGTIPPSDKTPAQNQNPVSLLN